mgnify:FL=1
MRYISIINFIDRVFKHIMNNDLYISPGKIAKQFDITTTTLRRWAEDGKIRCIRPVSGKRVYNLMDVKKLFGIPSTSDNRAINTICYARVSSSHQREDLERQVQLLRYKYPDAKIIKDIGSGLNWDRQGFKTLLDYVYDQNVKTVVVAYKDRLCRFAYPLVEWIFKKSNVELLVLNKDTTDQESTNELSEDLLSIVTVFVAKNNGRRAANNKRAREKKIEEGGGQEEERKQNDKGTIRSD